MNKQTTFKRIAIGTTFVTTKDGVKYRKVSGTKVFRINDNGTGRTHEKLTVPRNCNCLVAS